MANQTQKVEKTAEIVETPVVKMSPYEIAMYCHVDFYQEYDETGMPI